jgi:erythromycin esterase-like protein
MWRNTVVHSFVDWLRTYNENLPPNQPEVGFYGLDLYGVYESVDEVVGYLSDVDKSAVGDAQQRYACFTAVGDTPEDYALARLRSQNTTCEEEARDQLTDVIGRNDLYRRRLAPEDAFSIEQNARVVVSGEAYYRLSGMADVSTWNVRDQHMAITANALLEHLERLEPDAKIVIWAHNSHVGNAAATSMSERGEFNIGQLLREQYGESAVLIGFSTYTGTVTAAHNWGEDPRLMTVNRGLPESYEGLFHEVGEPAFVLNLRDNEEAIDLLSEPRLQRAIGVIYRPETERWSHYLEANLPEQFDAIIHIDETTALEPLDPVPGWQAPDS